MFPVKSTYIYENIYRQNSSNNRYRNEVKKYDLDEKLLPHKMKY